MASLRYDAWGQVRYNDGDPLTRYTYTGQYSHVDTFGLLFYNARYYSPTLGRFVSADTVTPPGAQGLDRYAYGNNNPLKYTDPSGHEPCGNAPEPWRSICLNNLGRGDQAALKQTEEFEAPLDEMDIVGWDYHDPRKTTHPGVDLDDNDNADIHASGYGVVHTSDSCGVDPCDGLWGFNGADVNAGYGNVVVIEYPFFTLPDTVRGLIEEGQSVFVLYAHLQEPSPLKAHDIVEPGEVIGKAGNTGNSTGPHLHLEVRVGLPQKLPFLPMATEYTYSEDSLFGYFWWPLPTIDPHLLWRIGQ